MEQLLESWQYGNINGFISKVGPRNQVYDMPNGKKMYVFGRSSSYTTPTYTTPSTYRSNTTVQSYGNTAYATTSGQIAGGQTYGGPTFLSSCTINFTVDSSDTIIAYRYEGNSCRVRERDH
jgi:hypothetical protein